MPFGVACASPLPDTLGSGVPAGGGPSTTAGLWGWTRFWMYGKGMAGTTRFMFRRPVVGPFRRGGAGWLLLVPLREAMADIQTMDYNIGIWMEEMVSRCLGSLKDPPNRS